MDEKQTQIPVKTEVREKLKFVKLLTGSDTYTETIEMLFDESGFNPPSGGFDAKSAKQALREMDNA